MRAFVPVLAFAVLAATVPSSTAAFPVCAPAPGGYACLLQESGATRYPAVVVVNAGGFSTFLLSAHIASGSTDILVGAFYLSGNGVEAAHALYQAGYSYGGYEVVITWSFGTTTTPQGEVEHAFLQSNANGDCSEQIMLRTSATGTTSTPWSPCLVPMPNVASAVGGVLDLL